MTFLVRMTLLLALVGVGASPGRLRAEPVDEGVPEYFLFQDPTDIGADGQLRPAGERIPVFLVHGFLKDDLEHERKIHVVFSRLNSQWIKQRNRRVDPFEYAAPLHYRYRPNKSYADLGREFARRVKELIGDIPCILYVHSAGALIARYAATEGLPILAVVGLAPAHGGSPGATLMFANRKILEDGRVEPEHFEVMERTLKEMGVPVEASRSLAWDNADGVLSRQEIEEYGLVTTRHPPFRYDRYDHYGILEHFVAPFAGLDFVNNSSGRKKTDREYEWELLGRFSPAWKHSDGVVVPYPATAADGSTRVWQKTYKGIGHREIFFDSDVLAASWAQVQAVAGRALGVEPEPETPEDPAREPQQVAAVAPSPTPASPLPAAPLATASPPTTAAPPATRAASPPPDALEDMEDLGNLDDLDLGDGLAEAPPAPAPAPAPAAPPVPVLEEAEAAAARRAAAAPPGRGVEDPRVRRALRSGLLPSAPRRRASAWLLGEAPRGRLSGWLRD